MRTSRKHGGRAQQWSNWRRTSRKQPGCRSPADIEAIIEGMCTLIQRTEVKAPLDEIRLADLFGRYQTVYQIILRKKWNRNIWLCNKGRLSVRNAGKKIKICVCKTLIKPLGFKSQKALALCEESPWGSFKKHVFLMQLRSNYIYKPFINPKLVTTTAAAWIGLFCCFLSCPHSLHLAVALRTWWVFSTNPKIKMGWLTFIWWNWSM